MDPQIFSIFFKKLCITFLFFNFLACGRSVSDSQPTKSSNSEKILSAAQVNALLGTLDDSNSLVHSMVQASLSTIMEVLTISQISTASPNDLDVARDPFALTRRCLTITTQPSPLLEDSRSRPQNYSVMWSYNACQRVGFGKQTGNYLLTFTFDPNSPNNPLFNASTLNEVNSIIRNDYLINGFIDSNRYLPSGYRISENANYTLHATDFSQCYSNSNCQINNNIQYSARLTKTAHNSKESLYDFNHTLNINLVETQVMQKPALWIIQEGQDSIHHLNKNATTLLTFNQLSWDLNLCSCPLSGSIISFTYDLIQQKTVTLQHTFKTPCGNVATKDNNNLEQTTLSYSNICYTPSQLTQNSNIQLP